MRRALVLAALAAPALAAAQVTAPANAVIELGNFNPAITQEFTSYINEAQCAGGNMDLQWNIPLAQGGTYQIIGSSVAPDASGCPTIEQPNASPPVFTAALGSVTVQGPLQGKNDLTGSAVFDAANPVDRTCSTAAEGSVVFVCVHWVNNDVVSGVATGRFLVQRAAPEPPTDVSVGSGDGKLTVRWTASAAGTVVADRYVARATPVGGGDTFSSGLTNATSAEISGLQNGTEYEVQVFALSVGRNESAGTAPVLGTPQPTDDFWDVYRNTPGAREQGGCGTGGTGALALLGVSLAALLRRRK